MKIPNIIISQSPLVNLQLGGSMCLWNRQNLSGKLNMVKNEAEGGVKMENCKYRPSTTSLFIHDQEGQQWPVFVFVTGDQQSKTSGAPFQMLN